MAVDFCSACEPCLGGTILNDKFKQLVLQGLCAIVAGEGGGGALPAGAATSALQTAGNTSLSTIATNTTGAATAAKQDTGNTSLGTIATNSGTQATAAKQDTGNTSLGTIATNSGTQATAAKQDTGNTSLSSIAANTGLGRGKTLKWATGTVSSSGVNSAIALVASKRIKVYELFLETTSTTLVTVTLQDDSGTPVVLKSYDLQAQTGVPFGVQASNEVLSPLLATTAGQALKINLSGAFTVRYNFSYYTDDAT